MVPSVLILASLSGTVQLPEGANVLSVDLVGETLPTATAKVIVLAPIGVGLTDWQIVVSPMEHPIPAHGETRGEMWATDLGLVWLWQGV